MGRDYDMTDATGTIVEVLPCRDAAAVFTLNRVASLALA